MDYTFHVNIFFYIRFLKMIPKILGLKIAIYSLESSENENRKRAKVDVCE